MNPHRLCDQSIDLQGYESTLEPSHAVLGGGYVTRKLSTCNFDATCNERSNEPRQTLDEFRPVAHTQVPSHRLGDTDCPRIATHFVKGGEADHAAEAAPRHVLANGHVERELPKRA